MSATIDPTVKFTDGERLLAVEVAHLEERVSSLTWALGLALQRLDEKFGPCDASTYAMNSLYPEPINGTNLEHSQAPRPPVPGHWLDAMARTGNSLAQVAGSRRRAEVFIERL